MRQNLCINSQEVVPPIGKSHLLTHETVRSSNIMKELLGHADVSTTMIYVHVLNKGGRGVSSPLDGLERPLWEQ
jgi:integrase